LGYGNLINTPFTLAYIYPVQRIFHYINLKKLPTLQSSCLLLALIRTMQSVLFHFRCLSKVPHLTDKSLTDELTGSNPSFFRKLSANGIISYNDFLFLLSLLTRPQNGFKYFNYSSCTGRPEAVFLVLFDPSMNEL
jgi:hypothetical protein